MPKKKNQSNTDKSLDAQDTDQDDIKVVYSPGPKIKKRLAQIDKRIEVMKLKKKELGIDERCDRMDVLFKPHLTSMNPSIDQDNVDFDERRALTGIAESENVRKSKPLAFRKVTTAQAKLIRENIKVTAKANKEKYKNLSLLAIKAYEENWKSLKLTRVLRSMVKDLALYGIAYGRRYLKRQWRLRHNEDGKLERVFLVNSIVFEKVNPRDVLLDDACTGPADAKDAVILRYYDQDDFDSRFPQDIFPNSKFVKTGQTRFVETDSAGRHRIKSKTLTGERKEKIQVAYVERLLPDTREIIANGVYLDVEPLPGGVLSIVGAKWIEDQEDYDGIGIGQVIELYQPLVDDILNASNERLRQIVRPVRLMGNDIKIADDSDQEWQAGAEIRVDGDLAQYQWDRPPATTSAELEERTILDEEIDVATMITKALEGLDTSDTAFQAAQNKEEGLSALSMPLDNLKDMLDDDANKFLRLAKVVYSEPEEVEMLKKGTPEFEEGVKVLATNPKDERFTRMSQKNGGGIARRRFHQVEINLAKELKKNDKGEMVDTGRVIETEEQEFWEMIPEHWNWEGTLEIIPMSFLPVSEAIEIATKKERAEFLLSIPTVDEETGQPILVDAAGQPFTIDKVRTIKDYVEATKEDPEKYVIPFPGGSPGGATAPEGTPETESKITERELAGLDRPEERVQDRSSSKLTQLPKT